MSDLSELAERCEKAEGADEALDGDICLAIGWTFRKQREVWFCADSDDDRYVWIMPGASTYQHDGRDWIDSGYYHMDGPVPFTGSLDAAMTLVPDGFLWRCGYSRHVSHQAELTDYKTHTGRYDGNSDHSRALALCAAALRARSVVPVSTPSGSGK